MIRKGVIHDASFITSDHGKHGRKKPPAPDMPDPYEIPVPADKKEAKRQARDPGRRRNASGRMNEENP